LAAAAALRGHCRQHGRIGCGHRRHGAADQLLPGPSQGCDGWDQSSARSRSAVQIVQLQPPVRSSSSTRAARPSERGRWASPLLQSREAHKRQYTLALTIFAAAPEVPYRQLVGCV
jgi:hypothetical protein